MTITPWKPTKQQLADAYGTTLRDVIADELSVLFVGINPGLYTAAIGHHFGKPGNRFWPALFNSGFTPRLFSPFEDESLIDLGCGITNLVDRATARADELSDDEFVQGCGKLRRKVQRRKIRCVAFSGITAFRAATQNKKAKVGKQPEFFGDAIAWVLPNPSGLNAHYQAPDFARLFAELREAMNLPDQRQT